jgi:hypothetical protein
MTLAHRMRRFTLRLFGSGLSISMAIPTAAIAVILDVQFKISELEMASSLLFSTVLHSDPGSIYVSNRLT